MFTDIGCCTCGSEDIEKGGQDKTLHHPRQISNTKYFLKTNNFTKNETHYTKSKNRYIMAAAFQTGFEHADRQERTLAQQNLRFLHNH